jgi:hypothetical protein
MIEFRLVDRLLGRDEERGRLAAAVTVDAVATDALAVLEGGGGGKGGGGAESCDEEAAAGVVAAAAAAALLPTRPEAAIAFNILLTVVLAEFMLLNPLPLLLFISIEIRTTQFSCSLSFFLSFFLDLC